MKSVNLNEDFFLFSVAQVVLVHFFRLGSLTSSGNIFIEIIPKYVKQFCRK